MTQQESACPLDCPDTCSLTVEVEDGRVTAVTGSKRNPLTAGLICGKVRKIAAHLYGDERLLAPMLRDGPKGAGRFRPISWDEAMERLTGEIRRVVAEHGGEAILPYNYGGSNGHLTQNSIDARLFRRLGASRLLRTLCAAPAGAAGSGLYGGMPGVALEDYEHANLIVLWGVNPSATSIHLVPIIRRARARGARLVVVDPRRIPLAREADLHIPLRPGSDVAVAMAIIDWLFATGAADLDFLGRHATGVEALRERAARWPIARAAETAGVDPALLVRFAEMYAGSSPAVIRCGWGQERNRNGGSSTAAVLALPAVAGKFGVRAGGYTQSNGAAWRVSREPAVCAPEPPTRAINMSQLGHALTELQPAVSLLFVYNCNPVATAPNQRAVIAGLERDDLFTVVSEQVHTDTAAYADLLLPATTFLEHRELRRGYGAMRMFDSPRVVAPAGQARSNCDVFAELLRRLDLALPGDPMSEDELVRGMLEHSPDGAEIRAELDTHGIAARPGGATPVLFVDVFPSTASGKIELVPEALDREAPLGLYGHVPDPADACYPLALISPATSRTISSTFGQLVRGEVAVEIHPDDAAARAIGHGDPVRIFNELGEIHCSAALSPDMRPGLLYLPKGLWRRHTANGATANAVIPETLSDLGGGACYNDARVQIARR